MWHLLLLVIFIHLRIIASLPYKINPYFQKIFRRPPCTGASLRLCQVLIFCPKYEHWEKSRPSKKWEVCPQTPVRTSSAAPLYTGCYGLWKTPVENSVENVENFDLSTVIPVLCGICPAVRSCTFGLHNTPPAILLRKVMREEDTRHFLPKQTGKVGSVCNAAVNTLPAVRHSPKYLCNAHKRSFCIDRGVLEILLLSGYTQEAHHATNS